MKERICRGAASRLGAIAAEKETFHLPPQLRHGSIQRFRPRIDDDGPLRIQPIERVPHCFTQPPFDPVARHRLAQSTGNRKSDPRPLRCGFAHAKGRKARARKPAALVINPSEVLRSQQADTFRKTSDGLVPLRADRELLAPTRPAPRQHRTAILCLHSGAETVRLGALAVVWLIRTLRHSSSTIQYRAAASLGQIAWGRPFWGGGDCGRPSIFGEKQAPLRVSASAQSSGNCSSPRVAAPGPSRSEVLPRRLAPLLPASNW